MRVRSPLAKPEASTADLKAFDLSTSGDGGGRRESNSARSSGPPGPDLTRAPRGLLFGTSLEIEEERLELGV
jgi:hypothetical protein